MGRFHRLVLFVFEGGLRARYLVVVVPVWPASFGCLPSFWALRGLSGFGSLLFASYRMGAELSYGTVQIGGGVPIRPIIITGPGQLVRFEMLARLSDAT